MVFFIKNYTRRVFSLLWRREGISFLELLIVIAILSVILIGAFDVLLVTSRMRVRNNALSLINENSRVVLGRIRDSILDSSSASVSGACPHNILTLTQGASIIVYQITGGVLELMRDGGSPAAISSDSVIATSGSCLFTLVTNVAPAKPTVQIRLRLNYDSPDNPLTTIFQDYQLTVSLR